MSGLTAAILLIVTFLALALVVRLAGNRGTPTRETHRDNHTDRP